MYDFGSLGIKIVLLVTYGIVYFPFRLIFNLKIKTPNEVKILPKQRYLIVANHRRKIDPYLILSTLPFNSFTKIFPIRFFTANIYLNHYWQRIFMLPFGCFRAYSIEGKLSGVQGGLILSDRNQTLFIFPEGKLVTNDEKPKLKPGIGRLIKARNFKIIPVFIKYSNRETYVLWGKPFIVPQAIIEKENEQFVTEYIFKRVLELEQ